MNILTDLNNLYDGYKASMKGSAWKDEPQNFEMDFLSELVRLKEELESQTYQTSPCSEFTLNERGKIRHIHGSRMRDRVVRHVLCDNVIGPAVKPYLIYNNGASQKGKGLSFSRKMFETDLHNFWLEHRSNDGYVVFLDLSKFYDNICHDKIIELMYPKIPEEYHWLLNEILRSFELDVSYMTDEEFDTYKTIRFDSVWYYENVTEAQKTGQKIMRKSVNIGDQFSQDVGVFFPTRIDNYAKIVRGCKYYGRYMDDIYFICKTKQEALSIIEGIKEQAKKLDLFINDKKTKIVKLSGDYRYLQIKYSLSDTGKVIKRINPKAVTRERRRLKAFKRLLSEGRIKPLSIENAAKSWMGEYTKLMSKQQIKHMKDLYRSLFGKELVWKRQ